MNVPTEEGNYVEALRRVARLADDYLDRHTANRVLTLIGMELERLGVIIDRTHHTHTDIRH